MPDTALALLAAHPDVREVAARPAGERDAGANAAAAVGAAWVREQLGLDGSGVGVAIIDSGVANWHDDLGAERVVHFADFVDLPAAPHDDYGHGTHVAGIIAGNGYDSGGARRGIAPGREAGGAEGARRRPATATSATSSRRSTTPSSIARGSTSA